MQASKGKFLVGGHAALEGGGYGRALSIVEGADRTPQARGPAPHLHIYARDSEDGSGILKAGAPRWEGLP